MSTATEQLSNNVTRTASPVANAIAAARSALKGKVAILTAADGAKFDAEITSWNADVSKYVPDTITQPTSTAEVGAVVAAANKHGARLVIAGGRHGHDCLAEGALVLDMSKMKKVDVDAERKLVTVEGGCKLGDMDRACRPHGLGCVTGTNPDTGVVGLSTAGGGGYLSRLHGMAVDNFVAATVVLASGEAVVATADNAHADLLWGLAGAGSNFGVVTSLTMRAHPVDHVFGGLLVNTAFTKAGADAVLANWREWITAAPRSVMSMAVLPCGAPVVPMVLAETDVAQVPQGDARRERKVGLRAIPAFRSLGRVGCFGSYLSIKQMKRMQYHTELQPLLEPMQAAGHYYDASCLVPALSNEVIATLTDFTRNQPVNKLASIIIFPMGGAVADAPVESTAFYGGGRKAAGFWIIIEGKFDGSAAGRAAVVDWVKRLRAALAKFDVSDTAHTLDGNMESELAGAAAIFGPNLQRLRAVKAKYDRDNFFQCNRNITPKDGGWMSMGM